ncbi:hypothetical protein; putative signal peptide [Frankia alni ACN14a]|uniref:Secreted protein n=1 Tax=Frankia alni (strain DSM 45986 / CECT 9034 / ACN14a) TaxID=326424 RepID=Q0RUJ3_FRAAA|nr:hypothetical protein; putative signal peptide [Frankia alni ACN14a]
MTPSGAALAVSVAPPAAAGVAVDAADVPRSGGKGLAVTEVSDRAATPSPVEPEDSEQPTTTASSRPPITARPSRPELERGGGRRPYPGRGRADPCRPGACAPLTANLPSQVGSRVIPGFGPGRPRPPVQLR